MDFVRNTLKIPAPKVYAWSSRATENVVGAEYIIMEKVDGVPLSQKWNKMTADDKESLIEAVDYLKVVLPINSSTLSPTIWHSDLHTDNIFVHPERPAEIVGLVDWQSVHLGPLLLQARPPAFLDFRGPKLGGLRAPTLPGNFGDLSDVEQKDAKALLSRQSLSKLYEVYSSLENSKAYQAARYQESLTYQIISLVGNLLQDGEPLVRGQLMQLERDWLNLPNVGGSNGHTCPLKYSSDDEEAQARDLSKWLGGILLMKELFSYLGDVETGWQGWVDHEDYSNLKDSLESLREQFLGQMAMNEEERALWDAAWPFKN